LLSYNAWANSRLLQAARSLPPHLLHQDLATSHTSVWGTLIHMAWGEWLWLGRWPGAQPPHSSPANSQTPAELEARWAEITRQQLGLIERLDEVDFDRLISYDNPPGTTWTYALGDMVRHVVNHSTYHRGQLASLLRQLGSTPPATDYLVFFDEGARHHPGEPPVNQA